MHREARRTLEAPSTSWFSAAVSSERIVVLLGGQTLHVWRLRPITFECKLELCSGEKATSVGTAGDLVAVGTLSGKVFVWRGGEPLRTLTGHHPRDVTAVAISGNRVVSGSDDCTIRVWDLDAGVGEEETHTLVFPWMTYDPLVVPARSYTWSATSVAIIADGDGDHVVASFDDGPAHFWRLPSGVLEDRFRDTALDFWASMVIPHTRVTEQYGELVCLWEFPGSEMTHRLPRDLRGSTRVVSMPFTYTVGVLRGGRKVCVWSSQEQKLLYNLQDDDEGDIVDTVTMRGEYVVLCFKHSSPKVWFLWSHAMAVEAFVKLVQREANAHSQLARLSRDMLKYLFAFLPESSARALLIRTKEEKAAAIARGPDAKRRELSC